MTSFYRAPHIVCIGNKSIKITREQRINALNKRKENEKNKDNHLYESNLRREYPPMDMLVCLEQ